MSVNLILDAIDDVAEATSVAAIDDSLGRAIRSCGLTYYAVLRHPRPHDDPRSRLLTVHFPAGWPDRYVQKGYVVIDPVIRYLGHVRHGFRWREAIEAFAETPNARRMERMIMDATRYGLHDGYLFPVHSRHGLVGSMTIGGEAVDLSRRTMVLLEMLAKRAFWRLIEIKAPEFLRDRPAPMELKLTHREMEALGCLSEGLTSPEIANVLEISNHTVDWYMNGIQQKLQARNRHHTVAIAFRLGLIS